MASSGRILVVDLHEGLLADLTSGPLDGADPVDRLRHVRHVDEAIREVAAANAADRPFAVAFVDLDVPALDVVDTVERLHREHPDLEVVGCSTDPATAWDVGLTLTTPAQFMVVPRPLQATVLRQLAACLVDKWQRGRLLAERVATLEARVAEEVAARMQIQTERTQKFDALGRLAAGIAHEINTPIQYLRSSLEFLGAALPQVIGERDQLRAAAGGAVPSDPALDELVAELPVALADADEGIDRVAKIIRGIQNYAHPSASDKTAVDINRQVVDMVDLARNEYKQDADVVLELGEVPAVRGQADALGCAILNLLINAAQAVREVRRERTARGTIRITSRVDADFVVVSIADTGPGIPEVHRDRIFSPFFTTKPVGHGTGQGLAIARATVVDGHRGRLTFDSQPGHGTTFHLALPICDPERAS